MYHCCTPLCPRLGGRLRTSCALLAFEVQYLVVYQLPWYTFCKTEVRQSSSAEAAACCCGVGLRCRPGGLFDASLFALWKETKTPLAIIVFRTVRQAALLHERHERDSYREKSPGGEAVAAAAAASACRTARRQRRQ